MIKFDLYDQYLAQHKERSEKLGKFQAEAEAAQVEVTKLKQQYEYFFTESIKAGTDDSARLAKLDAEITEAQKALAKAERGNNLAQVALPDVEISSVEVSRAFRDVYSPTVRKENIPGIEAKLKLARDLILSAIMDGRAVDAEYNDITAAIKEISQSNHKTGKTREWEMVSHPTSETAILGSQGGTVSGVRKVLEDVSKFTFGTTPTDFQYVDKAPVIKSVKEEN